MNLHIVLLSGGMGSFAEAYFTVRKYGRENVKLVFADTLWEDPDLYRFLEDTGRFLQIPVDRVSKEEPLWDFFTRVRYIGNSKVGNCSKTLKTQQLKKYCKAYPGATLHLGIDFSEHHRLTRVQKANPTRTYTSLCVEAGVIIPKDFSTRFGIRPPILYTLGFSHNNCGGYCVKAGLGQMRKLLETLPERFKLNEEGEQRAIKAGGLPPLRKQIDNKIHYISLQEFRTKYAKPPKEPETIAGCGCVLDDLSTPDKDEP